MVFSRDSYYVCEHLQDPDLEAYYENHVLPRGTALSDCLDENVLEWHGEDFEGAFTIKDKMMARAYLFMYAKCFPNLKRCYMGQLSINIPRLMTVTRHWSTRKELFPPHYDRHHVYPSKGGIEG